MDSQLKMIKDIYNVANAETKKILEASYSPVELGIENTPSDITERIKTYFDALEYTNSPDLTIEQLKCLPEHLREFIINVYKATIICEALNEGWQANWMNTKQKKWLPWFEVVGGNFVFDPSYYGFSSANAGDAARLCLKNQKLSDYAGTQFTEIFANVLTK